MKVLEKGKIKDTWPKGQPCANCKKPINQPISFNLSFSQPKNCDALVVPVVVHVKCLYVLNHKQEVWEENSPLWKKYKKRPSSAEVDKMYKAARNMLLLFPSPSKNKRWVLVCPCGCGDRK